MLTFETFHSHISRILFNGLHWSLLPVGLQVFTIPGNPLPVILFVYRKKFLIYSCICAKLLLYLFILNPLCLLYKLAKCVLLFILHIPFMLLLFLSSILVPLSNFQYRITELDWFDIMTVCNNIQISNCSHYTNFSSFFLLSYTQTDDCWFIADTSACTRALYN